MLSDHERVEIDKEIAKFPTRRNACLDALMAVQKFRGYISDEALDDVATYLGMSAAELDGIATFYNLIYRKPVGTFVIRLCDSVSCWIMGYDDVKQAIQAQLGIGWGETTEDERFTLLPAQCLGACDRACTMMINEELYTDVTRTNLCEILKAVEEQGRSDEATSHRAHEKRSAAAQPKRIPVGSRV